MNIVLIRPVDDPDIIELFLVQHSKAKKSMATFEKEWDKSLAQAKKEHPETWNVNEVMEDLELNQGWEFMRINDTTTVTY